MKMYSHYFKLVKHLTYIDVYRVLDLFKVERASVAHAVKKLLCAGNRGAKNYVQDITEARDSLNRELEMLTEDEPTVSLKSAGNDEIENFLHKQGVSEQPATTVTAYDVHIGVSQSQPMAVLYGQVVATLPAHSVVTITYASIFNYLFCLLAFHVRGRKTQFTKDELFRHHFEIKNDKLQVFDEFLSITQHVKFDFDAFDAEGKLIQK